MTPFTMFGHSPLFGDIVDLIEANRGWLRAVVQNMTEVVQPGTKSLATLIARHAHSQAAVGRPAVLVQQLEEFRPETGDQYVIGFRSARMLPLLTTLTRTFELSYPVLCHPSAVISPGAVIEEGTFIGAGVVVGSGAHIGRFVLLNRGSTIGHDCIIEDFANVGPGANLASFVRIGWSARVGIGANIVNHVRTGRDSVVAAGAVVLSDVPDGIMVAGVPARPKRNASQ